MSIIGGINWLFAGVTAAVFAGGVAVVLLPGAARRSSAWLQAWAEAMEYFRQRRALHMAAVAELEGAEVQR